MAVILPIAYTLAILAFALVTAGCGLLLLGQRTPRASRWDWLWHWVQAYALGLCLIAWLTANSGLLGLMRHGFVLPLVGGAAALGFALQFRRDRKPPADGELDPSPILNPPASAMPADPPVPRFWFWLMLPLFAFMALNCHIGGMITTTFQDDNWYHVSIPRQWMLTGGLDAFPFVYPSNYPLVGSAIHAVLLMAWDEVLCTLLTAQERIILLAAIAIICRRMLGPWGLLAATMGSIGLISIGWGTPPLSASNDALGAIFALVGLARLWETIEQRGFPGWRSVFVSGILLGSAAGVKQTTGGFIAPWILMAILGCAMKTRSPAAAAKMTLALFAAWLVVYTPWIIRGLMYSGNPFFPLGVRIFGLREPYEVSLVNSRKYNRIYPLTFAGIWEALTNKSEGLPYKMRIALTSNDTLLLISPFVALIGLGMKQWRWRLMGLAFCGSMFGFIMLWGFNETLRYFFVTFPLLAILTSRILGGLLREAPRKYGHVLLLILFVAIAGQWVRAQYRASQIPTVRWQFRPMVTQADREQWARTVEYGYLYLDYPKLAELVPRDAKVALVNAPSPLYLRRRAVWADVIRLPDAAWVGMDAMQVGNWLLGQEVDFVFISGNFKEPRIDELEARGRLRRIDHDGPDWRVWSVVERSGSSASPGAFPSGSPDSSGAPSSPPAP